MTPGGFVVADTIAQLVAVATFIGLGLAGYAALGPDRHPDQSWEATAEPVPAQPVHAVVRVFARLAIWGGVIALAVRWLL